jgi:hypothetical protein
MSDGALVGLGDMAGICHLPFSGSRLRNMMYCPIHFPSFREQADIDERFAYLAFCLQALEQ